MTNVTEPDVAPAAPEDDSEGSAASVWVSVALFVGFVVLASSCVALQSLF